MAETTINLGDRVQVNQRYQDPAFLGQEGKVVSIDDMPWPVAVRLDNDLLGQGTYQFDQTELDTLDEDEFLTPEVPC